MYARTWAAASSNSIPPAISSSNPDFSCMSTTNGSMAAKGAAGDWITRLMPSSISVRSASVTTQAISTRASEPRSRPVISQSIQTIRCEGSDPTVAMLGAASTAGAGVAVDSVMPQP